MSMSRNWFILVINNVDTMCVFYIKHFCGSEKKSTLNFELKISGGSGVFSRSMTGRCTPFEMGVEDAMRLGYTSNIEKNILEEICLVKNQLVGRAKYCLDVRVKIMQS